MRAVMLALALLSLTACGRGEDAPPARQAVAGREIPMRFAKTFRVVERDGYRVVDLKA